MLEVSNLSKSFNNYQAVNDLSFTLEKGHILGLLGQNGAGKTTTFRMLLNILNSTSGSIKFDGKNITEMDYRDVGFLTEERSLLAKYTVETQLQFFAQLKGMTKAEANTAIDYWLNYFEMEEHRKKKIKELSKGNQQKIQFISSFLHKPKLLILDEPFSGLDPFNINLFKKVILELKEEGICIVFSSHRLDHVELFCNNVVVLMKGKTVLQGSIDDLKKESKLFKVEIIGEIDKSKFEKFDYIQDLIISNNKYQFIINDYNKVKELNSLIKESDYIEKFEVKLPTLEEVFISKVGEYYE